MLKICKPLIALLFALGVLAGCASAPTSPFNNPDDQRDRRDSAMDELDNETGG